MKVIKKHEKIHCWVPEELHTALAGRLREPLTRRVQEKLWCGPFVELAEELARFHEDQ